MNNQPVNKKIAETITSYKANINKEFRERWSAWKIDLTKQEETEVIFGIMSRQLTIVTHYAGASAFWNADLAPIVLRSLVDNYINLAWILKAPEDRTKKFILHGIGQAKLYVEHLKAQLQADGLKPDENPMIAATEAWITDQRYPFLTTVNLGSWSEISTRKMAEEAECLDLYNYVYQPFSTAAHNMWNHISRHNLEPSDNPLHKYLLKPTMPILYSDKHYLELGAKYLAKMFSLFDKTYNYTPVGLSSFEILQADLLEIENKLREQQR